MPNDYSLWFVVLVNIVKICKCYQTTGSFFPSKLQLIKQTRSERKAHLSILDDMTIFISQSATQVPESKQWNQLFSQTLVNRKAITKHGSPLTYLHNICTSIWLTFSCLNIILFRLIRNILQNNRKNFH